MLFNSYVFIILFLPIAVIGYYVLGKFGNRHLPLIWLVIASLFYYGWWNPVYLWVITASVFFNFCVGYLLTNGAGTTNKKLLLIFGITANLSVLCYFKYANFFVDSINYSIGTSYHLSKIVLPLAISFFTFQQITYLVDGYRGLTREHSFLHYCVFVTFFPQLIAGPIVHHSEMLPQFRETSVFRFNNRNLAVGVTLFFIGLFKKVVLADSIALYATPIFAAADQGAFLSFFDSWAGALAFTFQLYFDFSGYSDMAIGCAKIFGISLPINFFSPYKADCIIEFWRRWHITLSRFLKDYLYIPLGGNRKGIKRRYINLFLTMLLGGLWHGAAWTFVVWGGLHGLFLMLNHLWRRIKPDLLLNAAVCTISITWFYRLLTFLAVAAAWVVFRAETFNGALTMYRGMLGLHGFLLPPVNLEALGAFRWLLEYLMAFGIEFRPMELLNRVLVIKLFVLLIIVWFLPNSQQILGEYFPKVKSKDTAERIPRFSLWRPGFIHALVMAVTVFFTLSSMTTVSEFLYYQF